MLVEDYSFPRDEAMDISDLISQLSSLKSDHEDWFEEYPISDLIDLDSSSSQQHSQSYFDHLTFIPSLEDQLSSHKKSKCWILNCESSILESEVVVKAHGNWEGIEREHGNLEKIKNAIKNDHQMKNYVVFCYGPPLQNLLTTLLHGIALDKGGENLEEYLKTTSSALNENDRIALGDNFIEIVSTVHESGLVWMDCKLSNVVRFHFSLPEWRGIDFEHSLEVGEEIPSHHGCTVLYAPPELVYFCSENEQEEGEERKESLVASISMDMWSVGVCLVEIGTGESWLRMMDVRSKEELIELYRNDQELEERLSNLINIKLQNNKWAHLRNLLAKLLKIDPLTRLSCVDDVKSKSYFSHGRITEDINQLRLNRRIEKKVDDTLQGVENLQMK